MIRHQMQGKMVEDHIHHFKGFSRLRRTRFFYSYMKESMNRYVPWAHYQIILKTYWEVIGDWLAEGHEINLGDRWGNLAVLCYPKKGDRSKRKQSIDWINTRKLGRRVYHYDLDVVPKVVWVRGKAAPMLKYMKMRFSPVFYSRLYKKIISGEYFFPTEVTKS